MCLSLHRDRIWTLETIPEKKIPYLRRGKTVDPESVGDGANRIPNDSNDKSVDEKMS